MPNTGNRLDQTLADLLDKGAPFGDAVRIALWRRAREAGFTADKNSRSAIADFAERKGLNRSNLTNALYNGRTPSQDMIRALIAELGGEDAWWRERIWRTAEPLVAVG